MTRYHVDSDAVLTATAATRGSIARLQSESAGLNANLSGLQSSWSGPAASAFHALLSEWTAAYQRVEQTLTAINEALGHAGQGYADVEHQASRMFMR